jgi:outer membrane protein assembly factor BamB
MNSGVSRRLRIFIPLWLPGMLLAGCGGRPVETIAARDAGIVDSLPPVEVAADDWPWWRGPQGDNHAQGPLPPTTWSETENVLWKAEVPGRGHASPCIWGDSVYIAAADEKQETQSLLCYDRETGKLRWTCEIHRDGFMHAHSKNSQASPTPACDGERVFTAFLSEGGLWVTAVDRKGKIVWQTQAGPFSSQHGYGGSPVIYKSLVIVSGDNQGQGYVAALHRQSGEIAWRTARDNGPSYGTPVLASIGGREQLLLSGQKKVVSYDPATGRENWTSPGPAEVTANTVAWNDELIFAGGGYPETGMMAIDGAAGRRVAWQKDFKAYVPSPLAVGERLFVMQDNGVARCLNAKTGEEIWTKRLGGNFTASPILAGDAIFVPDEDGLMHVFRAADGYETIAENNLRDGGFASPVICGGHLYLRTSHHLYCIGAKPAE